MKFVRSQNTEFKQSISSLSNTLSSLNQKLTNVTHEVNMLNENETKEKQNKKHPFSFMQVRSNNLKSC